ncbi:LysR family transcriptional regulator [Rhodococcus sp. P1Y]|uniref:LysR family transcriptional regulator n=1 Tax=Rhodococcus sp. P1Y TaxID=1302308 RepID=UPI000EAE35B1|nr:LysR family transcriptional regulator [Rhodococcus sp. P1Y]AYJ50507.1 LysR family transcriptional regulator [Rhodococcus sp. P1Y]
MDVELSLLRLLVEIDRSGSMTAAAETLMYTPSAVSQQIKRLESIVGTRVVERHARGVHLTDAGRLVAAKAVAIETHLSALAVELSDLRNARAGRVDLGVFPSFAASLLPDVISNFRAAHPGIELGIMSSRLRDLQQMLQARTVDVALAWDYAQLPMTAPGVDSEVIAVDQTVLLVPSGWKHRGRVTLSSLASEQWIVRTGGHAITTVFRRTCRDAGFDPDVFIESNDYMESQAMVAAGLGLAVAPKLTTRYLRDGVTAMDLAELPERRILLCRLEGSAHTPAGQALRAILIDVTSGVNSP